MNFAIQNDLINIKGKEMWYILWDQCNDVSNNMKKSLYNRFWVIKLDWFYHILRVSHSSEEKKR